MLWQPTTLVTLSLLSFASAGVIPRQAPDYGEMSFGEADPAMEGPPAEVSAPVEGEAAMTMTESAMAAETSVAMAESAPTMTEGRCGAGGCPPAAMETPPPAAYAPPPMPEETTSAAAAYASPVYGSGSANWNEYKSCVEMCQAKFGMGEGEMPPPPPPPTATEAPAGSKVHKVIVAPSKGVLRYVPFTIKINPGDTIEYVWGAGPHTVTESSVGGICNKSAGGFSSGLKNASATFSEVFNDTSTKFAYCTVPTHCQKGMFTIINPPEVPANLSVASNSTLSAMLPSMLAASPSLNATHEMAKQTCGNNSAAWSWMDNMDMSGMEDWAMGPAVENTMYTRMAYCLNPAAMVDGFTTIENFVQPPAIADSSYGGYGGAGSGTPASASVSAVPSVPVGAGAEGAGAVPTAGAAAGQKISGAARSTKAPASTMMAAILALVSTLVLF